MEVEWVEGLIEIIENYRIFFERLKMFTLMLFHSSSSALNYSTLPHTLAHKSSEISRLSNGRVSSECCRKASRDSNNCRRVWEVCSLDFHVKVERMCHTRERERLKCLWGFVCWFFILAVLPLFIFSSFCVCSSNIIFLSFLFQLLVDVCVDELSFFLPFHELNSSFLFVFCSHLLHTQLIAWIIKINFL